MLIKRQIYKQIEDHLNKKEISLVIGPRQSGKTTIINELRLEAIRKGIKTVYLNLDLFENLNYFDSQLKLIKFLELEIGDKGIVFIDEIQRLNNAGLFLKGIYDMNLNYKFVVTGSGSMELKEKISESLMGRKRVFEVYTLNFEEFVNFKTDYKYENNINELLEIKKEAVFNMLSEYLLFGGYPKVVLAKTVVEKRKEIEEIFRSYIEKDAVGLLNLEKSNEYSDLLRLISAYSGGLVDYSNLSKTIGINHRTVKKYLWYLEKTYIVDKVRPFSRNKKLEISKAPIYYFLDLGLRSFINGSFEWKNLEEKPFETGYLFQNFVFLRLKSAINEKNLNWEICFWRTKSGQEIDFVVNGVSKVMPVEVKFSRNFEKIPLGLVNFCKKYKGVEKAFVINLWGNKVKIIDGLKYEIVEFWKKVV